MANVYMQSLFFPSMYRARSRILYSENVVLLPIRQRQCETANKRSGSDRGRQCSFTTQTECHLSRLSRSLMIRTAFRRLLLRANPGTWLFIIPSCSISYLTHRNIFFRYVSFARSLTRRRWSSSVILTFYVTLPVSCCFHVPLSSVPSGLLGLRDGWIRFVRIK